MRIKLIKGLLVLIVLGVLFLHFYVPRIITEIKNPIIEFVKKPLPEIVTPDRFEEVKIISDDKLLLKGIYAEVKNAKAQVILLHGIRANKEHFIGQMKKLNKAGFSALAIDSRAHGESEGVHCTFGVKEKKDIKGWVDLLKGRSSAPVGVWGQSLGGAIGLQALSYDSRLHFGVIESTFSDYRSIVGDYFNYHLGFEIPVLTNYLVDRSGTIAKFNPDKARPKSACHNIYVPILMVHGDKDKRISIKYGGENFDHLSSQDKEFYVLKGGTHANVWKHGGRAYFEKVIGFLDRQVSEKRPAYDEG